MSSSASGVRSTERARIRRQKGVTVTGMILVSIVIIGVVLLAIKVVPVYVEYHTIQRNFRAMAEDPALASGRRAELMRAWSGRATVDNITAVESQDIAFERQGDQLFISADYSVKVPIFRNVNFCFDFHPTSAP
jgi:Domain of unknown function (DUF4845)